MAQRCLGIENGPPPRAGEFRTEVDVPQVFRLTPDGHAALGAMPLAYLRVIRRPTPASPDAEVFVRLLDGAARATRFSFSRAGTYVLQVRGARAFGWPDLADSSEPLPGCTDQLAQVAPPKLRRDFEGVRGQWWLAYRPAARAEIGGSVFVNRLGVAVSVEGNGPRFFGNRTDPENFNPVTVASEIRWRVARGYLGATVRYYPDDEPDRDRVRVGIAAGEELPSFKGLPIWMVVDLRVDEPRKQFWKGLDFAFAFRFDLPGSRP